LVQLELAANIDVDLKVMEVNAIHVLPEEMVPGTILDFYSCPLYIPTSSHGDHVGSAKLVLAHVFTHPPSKALAVN
jgi:hypothetical protein